MHALELESMPASTLKQGSPTERLFLPTMENANCVRFETAGWLLARSSSSFQRQFQTTINIEVTKDPAALDEGTSSPNSC
jgi:hypothetical protein